MTPDAHHDRPLNRRRFSRNQQRVEPVFPLFVVGTSTSELMGDAPIVLHEASNDGLRFKSDTPPEVGDVVQLRMRGFRDFSAMITGIETGGFVAMPTLITDIRAFANEIAAISREQAAEAKRRHERVVPEQSSAMVRTPDGSTIRANVIDVSLSGAAIESDLRPPLRSDVSLGKLEATVVRHLPNGFAVEFKNVLSEVLVKAFDAEESPAPRGP